MTELTARQQMVLDFIRASIATRGFPPTLREIGTHMGICSTNGVNDHLRALERKGHLRRDDMLSRGLLRRAMKAADRLPALTAEMVIVMGEVKAKLGPVDAGTSEAAE